MSAQLGPPGPFFKTIVQHSSCFADRLAQMARQTQQSEAHVCDINPSIGLGLIGIPLTHRHRSVGSVVACGMTDAFFDEENFARFCDMYQVDRLVFSRLAVELPRHPHTHLEAYANILAHHVGSFGAAAVARREIHNMSSHLARTYEELNLLYRISASMSVNKHPDSHFEQLCEELLSTTVVRSFAVILEPSAPGETTPRVIQAGPPSGSEENLLELYRNVQNRRPNAGDAVVVDDATADDELHETRDWLQQFVYYPLGRRDRHFGGVLAINHIDGTDFDSYEIQFINALAERSAAFLENVRLYEDLERLFSGLLHALISSIDAKDPYTCGHSQRVAWLSRRIAQLGGLSDAKCQRVYLSGLLHDIGKIGISESVLCKTGRLTQEEFQEMRRHPEIGARILDGVPQVADTIPGVLHHHERMDGRGYPSKLAAYDIPLLGRIIGLADSYDAMTTNRTYRKARPVQMAEAEIRRCSGTQFDPELAELFLSEDLKAIHEEVTAFGNLPIGSHPEIRLTAIKGEAP